MLMTLVLLRSLAPELCLPQPDNFLELQKFVAAFTAVIIVLAVGLTMVCDADCGVDDETVDIVAKAIVY